MKLAPGVGLTLYAQRQEVRPPSSSPCLPRVSHLLAQLEVSMLSLDCASRSWDHMHVCMRAACHQPVFSLLLRSA